MDLTIYVGQHCMNCAEALLLAAEASKISGVQVRVIDLDEPGHLIPPQVFAVPTYLLDGQVVSLGNPPRAAFLAHLCQESNQGHV